MEKFDHHDERMENEREPEDLCRYPVDERASVKMYGKENG